MALPWLFVLLFSCFQLYISVKGECNAPLFTSATVSASSSLSNDRAPTKARLNGRIAWTAGASDFGQFFKFDLGRKRNVTAIATQGRPFTSEFVQEYRIEYGNDRAEYGNPSEFGNDGVDYAVVKDAQGNPQVFKGNRDGNNIVWNTFEIPIIARWIRINPTRWRDRISMRIELYGCDYVENPVTFAGNGYIRKDLRFTEVASIREQIRLRFKTTYSDGILIYGHGTQGDYLALQLVNNKLLLNLDLGSKQMTSLSVGSLLDDNLWHDVIIYRHRKSVVFTVDRVTVKKEIKGDFQQLDLNEEMYVAGVPNFIQPGLVIAQNFTGCIENLFFNYTDFINGLAQNIDQTYSYTELTFGCSEEMVIPITFMTLASHIKVKMEMRESMNISFDFRTFNENGLLLYHKLLNGYLKLYLERGKIKLDVSTEGMSKITLNGFDESLNEGSWHRTMLIAAKDYLEVNVDGKPSKTKRMISIKTGSQILLGGGVHGSAGFIGCMRYITRDDGTMVRPSLSQIFGEVIPDSCKMLDRCNPNPCEHSGTCRQNAEEFFCDCVSGYGGAVCHSSIKTLSCEAFHHHNPDFVKDNILIDIDGSGPLDPFPVTCEVSTEGRTTTTLRHSNEMTTVVNGFDKRGSFIQDIMYDANFDQINELVNRSKLCKQRIRYDCKKSRLFNTPVRDNEPFEPYSWWISRENQRMDFWGGSSPGTRKCYCGLYGTCVDPTRWCNCDAFRGDWQSDEGDLDKKDYLPVRQLRFGDTGTPLDDKQGKYTLGPLICEGDYIYDNVVTFRREDATINYPTFDMGHSGDIYFEFKTTTDKEAVLVHSTGVTDFIKVSLVGGDQIQFSYYAGNAQLTVSVESSIKLNDDRWHSVRVERNRKEAEVVVDGSLINKIVEPLGISRAFLLTSDFVVGATVDYRNGYVGCMRALMLNGVPVDMRGPAEYGPGLYGVAPGCIGRCSSSPCLNNATCLEGYSRYSCDCRWTSFKGTICADEIGVNMRSDNMIKYEFEGKYKSTSEEKIRVAFVTTEPRGMLLGLFGYTGEYFTLIMANSGHLKITFDFGFERQEFVIDNQFYANGQTHDVWIHRRNGGKVLVVKIDNYEAKQWSFDFGKSQDVQFDNLRYLYIGRNETMDKGDGFVGCISRVEFDDVYALKLLFQEDKPPNIRAFPESPGLQEDFCGIEPITYPPDLTETRAPPPFNPGVLVDSRGYTRADSAVLGGILAIIFIALIAMAILIGRYVSRHKGEYKTHEDKGARDAPDADTAVVQGQTGHNVTKKKEIFI